MSSTPSSFAAKTTNSSRWRLVTPAASPLHTGSAFLLVLKNGAGYERACIRFSYGARAASRSSRRRLVLEEVLVRRDSMGRLVRGQGRSELVPTSLRSVSGAIRHDTPERVANATMPNRFRYWGLKERCAALHPMGFQSLRVPLNASGRCRSSNCWTFSLWLKLPHAQRLCGEAEGEHHFVHVDLCPPILPGPRGLRNLNLGSVPFVPFQKLPASKNTCIAHLTIASRSDANVPRSSPAFHN